jgi:hypothetical protein
MEGSTMDSERFDRLVRTFGQTHTRRQALRGLAGAAAAGTLGLGGQEARARKSRGGITCAADGSWCWVEGNKKVERKRNVRAQDDTCKREGKPCKKNSQCCTSNCAGGTGSGSTAGSTGICCPAGQVQGATGGCVAVCEPPGGPCTNDNFPEVCCPSPDGSTGCSFPTGDPNNGFCFI